MMETLDSGIGSRSPTPDSSHNSQTNSSKVIKVTTHTNHINNNSHNNNTSSSNGTHSSSRSKGSSSDKSDASSTTITTSNNTGGGGGGSNNGGSSNNQNNGSSSSNNHHGNNTSNNAKTYRDYNNRHSSGHGQYKKYASHQSYGYGGHNGHYQRYNSNTHRNYGNKHYHNSNYHHNNHHHYQGQGYQNHHLYGQQTHHQAQNNSKNNSANTVNASTTTNNSSNNGSEPTSRHRHHSHQYYQHPGTSAVHHHNRNVPPVPPQVFISDTDALSWQRHTGEESNNTSWSSPNLESVDSSVQISLNLSALKQNFYSPSPQNASPAVSPSTTDSSDAYSLQEDANISGSNNGVVSNNGTPTPRHNNGAFNYPAGGGIDTGLNGTTPNGNPFPYHHYHPGFYTYPGANNTHPMCANARSFSHHHHQLIAASQNFQGLLMPADSSFTVGKADSSISSSGSEKTVEWAEDGSYYPMNNDREDFLSSPVFGERCTTPDFIYAPLSISSGPITAGKKRYFSSSSEKKRQILDPLADLSAGYLHYSQLFYNGTASTSGKLSPATQNPRFHHYSRKMTYPSHGFPREFFDDLDPEDYVRAFSKFGEVKERPAALKVPQCDSLSEGIWLKFVENQQTTATFRKKMELWRDVYRIVRNLTFNAHFKPDPRNFPTFGLQVVGSTMSGFGSNTSDVDMCLLVRGSEVDQRYEAVDKLQVLYGALSGTQWIDNVELIYAKVPILKFRDPKRSLEVDLNCNNFVGIRNTHLLYCYSQADWRLKPLVLVVKLWAHNHGINDAKNMTISSYSLVLMVIHFLQCGVEEPVLPVLQQMYPDKFSNATNILHVKINEVLPAWQSKNNESIGNLLIQFLEYYAHKFDYSENAVSVRTGGTIPIKQAAAYKSVKNDPHQWKYLCIEEPFDRTNTARSVYDRDTFDKIVGIFNLSYQRLLASRDLEEIFAPIPDTDARAMAVLLR